jgi:hypothetical protein
MEKNMGIQHKRRTMAIRLMGAVILCLGVFSAVFAPLEIYCFYLFSEGGAFHYEGFRFGSFMFGNLATQILGYYFLAAVLIPVGYGTLMLKGWARHLTLALVRFWIVAGIPLILAFFFVLLSSKQLSLPLLILIAILVAASYLLLPWLLVRFHESPETMLSFGIRERKESWIEGIPIPALALAYVFLFFLLVLHSHIFFNGLFPLFGHWILGLEGIVLLDVSIIILVVILWGTLKAERWAWWCALAYFCLMLVSYVTTLLSSGWTDILSALSLPAFEVGILQNVPLQAYHLAITVGIPFLLTIGLVLWAKPAQATRASH